MSQMLKSAGVVWRLEPARRSCRVPPRKADPHDETGAYEASIHVEMETHPSRVVAHVVASDWKSHILEARYGILARALDAAR